MASIGGEMAEHRRDAAEMTFLAGHAGIERGLEASHAWLAALALAIGLGMAAPASANDPPEWSTPVKPFNIAGDVYYVGTQGLAA